jgi:hypothetical protein
VIEVWWKWRELPNPKKGFNKLISRRRDRFHFAAAAAIAGYEYGRKSEQ